MTGKDWTKAHDETDVHIAQLAGFAAILREVTMEWPTLNSADPVANGVLTMIRAIDDGIRKLEDMHSEEYRLKSQKPAVAA
ncbi:hypothetical protein FA743_10925 [Paracoccus gahaiensis]|uniref:Uncharacterized protein n=1 Tax=Paracoccus gahaiensis TaxID=1706839 RepID=A0A4U0R8X9_9RHOB|nr:hypothetical protein [Paracoccus gahaiensis]TJZ91601.1 hypothetical protein FA743_10925 [Paracoccus gahaiensis]